MAAKLTKQYLPAYLINYSPFYTQVEKPNSPLTLFRILCTLSTVKKEGKGLNE
jgi:hypothetical protein